MFINLKLFVLMNMYLQNPLYLSYICKISK